MSDLRVRVSGKTEVKLEILAAHLGATNRAEAVRRCIKALHRLHATGRVDLSTILYEEDDKCEDAPHGSLDEWLYPKQT